MPVDGATQFMEFLRKLSIFDGNYDGVYIATIRVMFRKRFLTLRSSQMVASVSVILCFSFIVNWSYYKLTYYFYHIIFLFSNLAQQTY